MAHFFHIKQAEAEAGQRLTTQTPKEGQSKAVKEQWLLLRLLIWSTPNLNALLLTLLVLWDKKPPGWAPPQQTLWGCLGTPRILEASATATSSLLLLLQVVLLSARLCLWKPPLRLRVSTLLRTFLRSDYKPNLLSFVVFFKDKFEN